MLPNKCINCFGRLDVGTDRPMLSDYMARVRQDTQPHYDEVHAAVFKLAKKYYGLSRQ